MQHLVPAGRRLTRQLAARERRLLVVAGLVLLAAAATRAADWAAAAEGHAVAAETRLATLRAGSGAPGGRLSGMAREEAQRAEDWFWDAPSAAMAPLILEARVQAIARTAGSGLGIAAEPDVQGVGRLKYVRVQADGAYDAAEVGRFIRGLRATGKAFLVNALELDRSADGARIRLVLDLPLDARG